MTDDAPFMRAILAEPADDAPRLVYADWLDDHGQPDRAEFIRLQIRTPGTARERELFLSHYPDWFGSTGELASMDLYEQSFSVPPRVLWPNNRRGYRVVAERGFLSRREFTDDGSLWLRHADHWTTRDPISDVALANPPAIYHEIRSEYLPREKRHRLELWSTWDRHQAVVGTRFLDEMELVVSRDPVGIIRLEIESLLHAATPADLLRLWWPKIRFTGPGLDAPPGRSALRGLEAVNHNLGLDRPRSP